MRYKCDPHKHPCKSIHEDTHAATHAFTFMVKSKSVPMVWQTFWWCMLDYLVPNIRIRIAPKTEFRVAATAAAAATAAIISSSIIVIAIATSMVLVRKWNILSGGNGSGTSPSSTQCTTRCSIIVVCYIRYWVVGTIVWRIHVIYFIILLLDVHAISCHCKAQHSHTHML